MTDDGLRILALEAENVKQPPGPFEKGLRRARSTLQREGKRT